MRKKIDLSENWQYVKNFDAQLYRKKEIPAQIVELTHHGEKDNHCYYRRDFFVEESLKGRALILKGLGIVGDVKIQINGITLEKGRGIDQPFFIYIEDRLLYGIENRIELEIKSKDESALVRTMSIEIVPSLHIEKVAVSSRDALNQSNLLVKVDLSMEARVDCVIKLYCVNKTKRRFLTEKQVLHSGLNLHVDMPDVKFWDIEDPHKYTFEIELSENGTILDQKELTYGFRSLSFERGHLMMNEKRVPLQGAYLNPEEKVNHLVLQSLKKAGVDVILVKKKHRHPEFYESCDKLGILVVQEINLMRRNPINFERFDHLNNPCIIMINALTHSMLFKEQLREYFFMTNKESLLLIDEHSMFTNRELQESNIWIDEIGENEFYPVFGQGGFLKEDARPTRAANMLAMKNKKNTENFFCIQDQSIYLLLSTQVEVLMNGFSLGQFDPKDRVIIIPDILPKDLGYKKKKANQYLREILQDAVFTSMEESLQIHSKHVKKLEKKWKISKKEILKKFAHYFPKESVDIELIILNKK